MAAAIDLDAYFERIGYSGPRRPAPDTLRVLHALHPAAIAFENLNPLLGWPVALDPAALQGKLIQGGRGGWCFEQNTLFLHVLEALGFAVTPLAARVLWNAAPGAPVGPRSHMLLRVEAGGGAYLADVGFGGNVLTGPLRLEPHSVQTTPHEPHRLVPVDGALVLEMLLAGEWKPLYRFTLEPQFPADYEVSNWYLCHHPSSIFRQTLMCARATAEARYALRGNTLAVHRGAGSEKRVLGSAEALRSALEKEFALRLPESADLDAALARTAAG